MSEWSFWTTVSLGTEENAAVVTRKSDYLLQFASYIKEGNEVTLDEFREATKKLPGETQILQKKPMMKWVPTELSVEDLIITRKWEYTKAAPGVPAPKDAVAVVKCVVLK